MITLISQLTICFCLSQGRHWATLYAVKRGLSSKNFILIIPTLYNRYGLLTTSGSTGPTKMTQHPHKMNQAPLMRRMKQTEWRKGFEICLQIMKIQRQHQQLMWWISSRLMRGAMMGICGGTSEIQNRTQNRTQNTKVVKIYFSSFDKKCANFFSILSLGDSGHSLCEPHSYNISRM